MKMLSKMFYLCRFFCHPFFLLLSLATLLLLPAASVGFLLDDYLFLQKLVTHGVSEHLFNLYAFASHGEAKDLIVNGFISWWGNPNFQMDFFRPLSSLFFSLNFVLFGKNPLAYHLHLLLWVFFLLSIWYSIFKMLLPYRVNLLALVILITSGVFVYPVFYTAESHTVLATTFASLGLWWHLLYRHKHWKYGLPLSISALLMGLLASESAVGIFIYLFCYEWLFSKDAAYKRSLILLPSLALLVIYCIIYKIFQYGTDTNYYFDPLNAPFLFIKSAFMQFPVLFDKLYFGFFFKNDFVLNLIITVVIGSLLVLYLYKQKMPIKSTYCWFAVSSVLSLLPVLTILIDPHLVLRVLLPSMIGTAVIVASLIIETWEQRKILISKGYRLNLLFVPYAIYLVVTYLILSPLAELKIPKYINQFNQLMVNTATKLKLNNTCEYVVNIAAPDYMSSFFLSSIRTYYDLPSPNNWYVLAENARSANFIKIAPYQFVLETQSNNYSYDKNEQIFKNDQLKNGETFQTKIFQATVLASKNQTPTKILFKFYPYDFDKICWITLSPVKRHKLSSS